MTCRRFLPCLSLALASGLLASACSGSEPARASAARTDPEASGEPARPSGGGDAPTPIPPGPAPTVRVRVEIDPHARTVLPRIESVGAEPVQIGAIAVQKRDGDTWTDVAASLALRDACGAEPVECATLVPGAAYHPPPWLGKLGDAQCDCDGCAPAEPGTYRFVVRGCGPTELATGEPFDLPAAG